MRLVHVWRNERLDAERAEEHLPVDEHALIDIIVGAFMECFNCSPQLCGVGSVDDEGGGGGFLLWESPEYDFSNDAQIARTSATESPIEIFVGTRVRSAVLTIGSDDLEFEDIVSTHPVESGHGTVAASLNVSTSNTDGLNMYE